ncbi:MAG: transposase [Okeania sp. SIO2C9]|uniref:transposase n=1 Tax=Okeania sp. SIO2C9 TaxID=2607791 RepID=UPI0013C05FFC|nr:transposase [Okeania sp. SIO2C9]NEQ76437.1 transposase [Okeania sp. SIO2C9]
MSFNALLNRKGHFWEQRYTCHGFPNSDKERALNTIRYIHANPKAAGMREGFFYDFSNYGTYEQLTTDGITQWHPAFLELGSSLSECADSYKGFCRRYTPRKKRTKKSDWGKRILRGILSKVPKTKVSPGQIPLPFLIEKIVYITIPEIAQTAKDFIKANRLSYYYV